MGYDLVNTTGSHGQLSYTCTYRILLQTFDVQVHDQLNLLLSDIEETHD